MLSFSKSILLSARLFEISIFEIEPKSLPSGPTFVFTLISNFSIFLANLFASSIIAFSLKAFCLRFSAKTFLAEVVARTALPLGIR